MQAWRRLVLEGGAWAEGGGDYIGMRGDIEVRYGFNPHLQLNGRVGFGWGTAWRIGEMDPIPAWGTSPTLDAGLGIQAALPLGPLTPALRVELAPFVLISNFLLGIGQKREWVTLGGQVYTSIDYQNNVVFPLGAFIGIHPTPRWTIFAGSGIFTSLLDGSEPLFSVGLGYKVE